MKKKIKTKHFLKKRETIREDTINLTAMDYVHIYEQFKINSKVNRV